MNMFRGTVFTLGVGARCGRPDSWSSLSCGSGGRFAIRGTLGHGRREECNRRQCLNQI